MERQKKDYESRPKDFYKEWPPEKLEFEFLFSPFPGEGLKTARKYGLRMLWHYDNPLWDPYKVSLPFVFLQPLAIEVIPHGLPQWKSLGEKESTLDLIPHLQERRFLTLKIDLNKPKGQILEEVDYHIERYAALAGIITTGRQGKRGHKIDYYLKGSNPKVSICEIWKKNKKEGKGAWLIAKEIWPDLEGYSPNDYANNFNSQAKKGLKRVEDAIDRADHLISSVNLLYK